MTGDLAIDVRESSHVKRHATSSPLVRLWTNECGADAAVHFAVLYTNRIEKDWRKIEGVLRDFYQPPDLLPYAANSGVE